MYPCEFALIGREESLSPAAKGTLGRPGTRKVAPANRLACAFRTHRGHPDRSPS